MPRKSHGNKFYNENVFYTLTSSFIGLVIMLLFVLLFAFLLTKVDAKDKFVSMMSTVSLCVGAYCGGYIASRLKRRNGLVIGLLTGLFIYFIIFLAAVIFAKTSISFGFVTKLIITVVSAAIGGIIGVNSKHKKY